METIQEADVPGSPSAADHRTYSNPAFQGGSVGEPTGYFLLSLSLSLSLSPSPCAFRPLLVSGSGF
jgi:hypothetical protein